MSEENDKKTVEQQLEEEIKKLQTKADEVKVQAHLAGMDAKDKAQPYIDKLEQDLAKAKKEWNELGEASEGAWDELSKGLRLSFKAMKKSAEKAKEHFKQEED